MSRTRFTPWVVLACIGTLAACTADGGGPPGNTELTIIMPNGAGNGSTAPDVVDVTSVEYTIVCQGGEQGSGFLGDNDTFVDAVTLNGNLEVQDGSSPPIAQGFMDIPPGDCLIQLRARDNDGEVICTGDNLLDTAANQNVDANEIQHINIVLDCYNISFQAPVGQLDITGDFIYSVGNFCADLFVLNCLETDLGPIPPDAGPEIEGQTTCEVRFRDGDDGCHQGCDPQVCQEDANGLLACTPASPPEDQLGNSMAGVPVRATITCNGGTLDCNNDGTFGDSSCTIDGDQLGTLPLLVGIVPNPAAFGISSAGAAPGAAITCTAYTTDGDRDCDKTKSVTVNAPGLNFCDQFAPGDNLTDCSVDLASTCLVGSCDRAAQACVTDPAPAGGGQNCTFNPSAPLPGTCDGAGNCDDFGCQTDADCDPTPSNACTVAPSGACVPPTCCLDGDCSGEEVNVTDGTACTTGSFPGTCDSPGGVPGDSVCVKTAVCGDGFVDPLEDCDNGAANSDTVPNACRTDCTNPSCGDGVVDTGEQCEPPGTATCDASCQIVVPCPGNLACPFTSATGSQIILNLAFGALPLAASGSANVTCAGSNLNPATGKCACRGEFVSVAPLVVPSIGDACLIPVPAAACPAGDVDCNGGNDQDIDLTVNHNLNFSFTPNLPACTGHSDCAADCVPYCGSLGAIPASAQCEGFCQVAGTACTNDAACPSGDTCVGGEPVIHAGACQCSCLTIGDGTPDAAGDARFFAGFGLNVLLATDPTDRGPDGLPCTVDDAPSITIPPQCAPFTTGDASTQVLNAANAPGALLPATGPATVSGTPFTCGGGIPTGTSGTNLRTAASFLDSTLGDIAATVSLNCQ